jgi:hypothetical protein
MRVQVLLQRAPGEAAGVVHRPATPLSSVLYAAPSMATASTVGAYHSAAARRVLST